MYHVFSLTFLKYLIPLFLAAVPFILQQKVNLRFTARDAAFGIVVSALLLLPFAFLMSRTGKIFAFPSAATMFFHLFGVAFPEEIYFRGYLQEKIGNTVRGTLFVSALFSLMHLPQLILYGDIYSVMTFFPSIVMGLLYVATSNVLSPAIFHFFANIVFLGFGDMRWHL